jgi:hypothetical protein
MSSRRSADLTARPGRSFPAAAKLLLLVMIGVGLGLGIRSCSMPRGTHTEAHVGPGGERSEVPSK